jgi:hypothetical protein
MSSDAPAEVKPAESSVAAPAAAAEPAAAAAAEPAAAVAAAGDSAAPAAAASAEEEAVEGADSTADYQPVVQLKPVEVSTGEEGDEVLYKQSVFFLQLRRCAAQSPLVRSPAAAD